MDDKTSPPLGLPAIHTVPTHLAATDTALSLGSLPLSSRQVLLLLVGGSVTASLWTRTAILVAVLPPLGAALHLALLIACLLVALALTFGQAQGRSFDAWVIVIGAYLARPRLYLWHRCAIPPAGESEQERKRT